MSTQITKRDIKLLIILGGVLVLVACYFFVYNNLTKKRDEVEAQIEELEPQLKQYREYAANQPKYEAATKEAKENIAATLAKLPSSYNPEDVILYATGLEKSLGIDVTALSFADPVAIAQFTGVTADDVDNAAGAVDMTAYETQTTVALNLDYLKLKNLLNSVYNMSDTETGVDSVTVSYDAESAGLTGTVVLDKFYLTYNNAPDYVTQLPATNYGVANPFGTIDHQ